jgi:nitrile hydratase accessory protein
LTPLDPPVFSEPWQATAFALTVTLNARGLFTWEEWTQALGRELRHQTDDAGYFEAWLRALEKMTIAKGAAKTGELEALAEAWIAAAEATPHGQPIVLGTKRG